MLINFGIKDALQKLIPEYRERYNLKTAYRILQRANRLIIYFSVIGGIFLFVIAPYLSAYWKEPDMLFVFRYSAFFLPFLVLGELNNFSLRALLKAHAANVSLITPTVIRIIILFLITYFYFNSNNPIYLHWTTLCLLPWLFSLIPIYKYFIKPSKEEPILVEVKDKEILAIAYPMFITYAAFLVVNSADVFLLKAFGVGTDQVGIYKTCTNISMLAATFLVALNTTVQPKITQLYTQGQHAEVQRIIQKFAKLIFLLSLPIFLLLFFCSKYIMWLYGSAFMTGAFALSVLTAGQIFNTLCGPVAQLLNATGHHKQFRNISLFGAVMNIFVSLLLIPKYGISGAAFANTISMIAWNIIGVVYIKRKFGYTLMYLPFISNRKSA